MFIYVVFCIIAGITSFILFATLTKKAEDVKYNGLDKAGRFTNVFVAIAYILLSPISLFVGLISNPAYEGFLGIIGWIISLLSASARVLCGLGLGFSVAFRKKGKSKLSFAIQFLGFVAIAFTITS